MAVFGSSTSGGGWRLAVIDAVGAVAVAAALGASAAFPGLGGVLILPAIGGLVWLVLRLYGIIDPPTLPWGSRFDAGVAMAEAELDDLRAEVERREAEAAILTAELGHPLPGGVVRVERSGCRACGAEDRGLAPLGSLDAPAGSRHHCGPALAKNSPPSSPPDTPFSLRDGTPPLGETGQGGAEHDPPKCAGNTVVSALLAVAIVATAVSGFGCRSMTSVTAPTARASHTVTTTEGGLTTVTESVVETAGAGLSTASHEAALGFATGTPDFEVPWGGRVAASAGSLAAEIRGKKLNVLHLMGGGAMLVAIIPLVVKPRRWGTAAAIAGMGVAVIAAGTVAETAPWIYAVAVAAFLAVVGYLAFSAWRAKQAAIAIERVARGVEDAPPAAREAVKASIERAANGSIGTVRAVVRRAKRGLGRDGETQRRRDEVEVAGGA